MPHPYFFFIPLCHFSIQNNMEITGKIIQVLPERGGTSARTGNEWKLVQYVLETLENYPRRMCFEVFGSDRISQFNIQVGEVLTVSFDIDARDYQGRWYNSIRAWKVDRNVAQTPTGAPAPAPVPDSIGAPMPAPPIINDSPVADIFGPSGAGDDLPF